MRTLELVAAGALGLLGARSLVHWVRRPVEGTDVRTHVAFAAFVLGRVGVWWSLAGFFLISASIRNPDPRGEGAYLAGRAFTEEFRARFWWYPLIVLGFAVLQLVASVLMGGLPAGKDPGGSGV
jgi:hypothetical protein